MSSRSQASGSILCSGNILFTCLMVHDSAFRSFLNNRLPVIRSPLLQKLLNAPLMKPVLGVMDFYCNEMYFN